MAEDPRQYCQPRYCHPHVIMTRNGWAPYAGDLRKHRAGTITALLAARKAALEAGDAEQARAAADAIDAIYNAATASEGVGLAAAFKAANVLTDSIDAGRMTLATNDADAEVREHLVTPDKLERPKKFAKRMASQIFGGDLDDVSFSYREY